MDLELGTKLYYGLRSQYLPAKSKRCIEVAMAPCKRCGCDLPTDAAAEMGENRIEHSKFWAELRENGQVIDGVIRCTDGKEFKVHRSILAASIPYFKALFTNSINPEKAETTEANVQFSSEIFELMLDYSYTGDCAITESNVRTLLKVSDKYGILGIVRLCSDFLLDNLNPYNCLGVYTFAKQYFCEELARRMRLFALHHFESVVFGSEFLELPFLDLQAIVRDDQLNVKSEKMLVDSIMAWTNHMLPEREQHLFELIRCVRIAHMNFDVVTEMAQWPLIQQSKKCSDLMNYALALMGEENHGQATSELYIFRPRIPYEIIFVIGGWNAGCPTNIIETYDVRADRWLTLGNTGAVCRSYHGVCTLNGLIYVIGGFDGVEYFSTVQCFNPVTQTWSERGCMYQPRCYVSIAVLNNQIYALGGFNGRIRLHSVERYTPETNQWEIIAPMHDMRSDANATTFDNKIYIVGGFDGREVLNSTECYDPVANRWSYFAPMNSARSGVELVALKNVLYAIGGFNGVTRLTSCEKISPLAKTGWVQFSEMMTPRSNFASVVMDNHIYVIGGFNDRFISGSNTVSYMEYFDPENSEWYDAASMNLCRSAVSACIVSGLPNAKDYAYASELTCIEYE